jgi:FKBP-type peptidyl-prolyl cis-trans isomerase
MPALTRLEPNQMNFSTRCSLLAATLSMVMVLPAFADAPETEAEKLGYLFGLELGGNLRQQQLDSIDIDALIDGLRTAYEGGEPALSTEEIVKIREAYLMRMQQERAESEQAHAAEQAAISEQNRLEGEAFLAANAEKEGVVTTESGLQYLVVEPGTGAPPDPSAAVTVHYTGTFLDGNKFDSSVDRGQPFTFTPSERRVIQGWVEGITLMPVGSKYTFFIKPELAYGEFENRGIPGNSTLVFEVEMLEFTGSAE